MEIFIDANDFEHIFYWSEGIIQNEACEIPRHFWVLILANLSFLWSKIFTDLSHFYLWNKVNISNSPFHCYISHRCWRYCMYHVCLSAGFLPYSIATNMGYWRERYLRCSPLTEMERSSCRLPYHPLKQKGCQDDSPGIHWRRWSLSSMSPVNIGAASLMSLPFQCHWRCQGLFMWQPLIPVVMSR